MLVASCIGLIEYIFLYGAGRITTYVKLIDHEHIGILWFTIFGSSDLREHSGIICEDEYDRKAILKEAVKDHVSSERAQLHVFAGLDS